MPLVTNVIEDKNRLIVFCIGNSDENITSQEELEIAISTGPLDCLDESMSSLISYYNCPPRSVELMFDDKVIKHCS